MAEFTIDPAGKQLSIPSHVAQTGYDLINAFEARLNAMADSTDKAELLALFLPLHAAADAYFKNQPGGGAYIKRGDHAAMASATASSIVLVSGDGGK